MQKKNWLEKGFHGDPTPLRKFLALLFSRHVSFIFMF